MAVFMVTHDLSYARLASLLLRMGASDHGPLHEECIVCYGDDVCDGQVRERGGHDAAI